MNFKSEEHELLKKINEVRRNLRDIISEWEKPKNLLNVNQENVDYLNSIAFQMQDLASEFENRYKAYEKVKLLREEEERMKAHILNSESIKHLNIIFNELNQIPGALEEDMDYETSLGQLMINEAKKDISISKLIDNMEAFLAVTKNK